MTETPGWGQVLAVLFAQMGAVRRGRPSPRRTQHTEVAGARQGEFCRWEHGFSFPWETGSGGGLGSDGVAQPIAPRECWEWWRDKNQGDLNTQRGRAVPQPCHSVGPLPLSVPCRVGQPMSRTSAGNSTWSSSGNLPVRFQAWLLTLDVEREGGACCPARIGNFPVVQIPSAGRYGGPPALVMMPQRHNTCLYP